ncbi:IucA/IucC family protein [Peredibacter sp. HCB2-198]|uniref:IucA/IucC family protein n=1 Tax=Peredibacter sp. HCB2-198 TaxID=3383025 RepID=UPI0038B68D9E
MIKIWNSVNQDLVAKSIGELTFEEVLRPELKGTHFEFTTQSGVVYRFEGWKTVWEYLRVKPATLLRNGEVVVSAAQFFSDIQLETGMNDITLGNFLEEMHNTLYSDTRLKERNKATTVKDLAHWNGEKIQTVLNGHPKILLNKGRVGWNAEDLEKYAPESHQPFKLFWIAVKKELLNINLATGISEEKILAESFGPAELSYFKEVLKVKGVHAGHTILPVHPWQWKRYIQIQFAAEIAAGSLIPVGEYGDDYCPQISIRTLSNVSRPEKMDIKLPLSILNTSCIRGLPAKHVEMGPSLSHNLEALCQSDETLKDIQILKEAAGVTFVHPSYKKIEKAPYRYHEFLGAVYRESSMSKLANNEKAILTASLFHQDENGDSLIGEYIRASGLAAEIWLRSLFETVVVPLYHLQLKYGVGLVAHGQNIVLVLKDHRPHRMILKDFHGDMRLLTELPEAGQKYFSGIHKDITKLPPHYLIHDLVTGHFVTVLRFISAVMKESEDMEESLFYGVLSDVIELYKKSHQVKVDQQIDLLQPQISRVLLNKVRFNIGYGDSDARPLPILGSPLNNPLVKQASQL